MPYPDRKLSSWIFHPRGSYWDWVIQSRTKSYVMELSRRIRQRASAFLLLLLLLPVITRARFCFCLCICRLRVERSRTAIAVLGCWQNLCEVVSELWQLQLQRGWYHCWIGFWWRRWCPLPNLLVASFSLIQWPRWVCSRFFLCLSVCLSLPSFLVSRFLADWEAQSRVLGCVLFKVLGFFRSSQEG